MMEIKYLCFLIYTLMTIVLCKPLFVVLFEGRDAIMEIKYFCFLIYTQRSLLVLFTLLFVVLFEGRGCCSW